MELNSVNLWSNTHSHLQKNNNSVDFLRNKSNNKFLTNPLLFLLAKKKNDSFKFDRVRLILIY